MSREPLLFNVTYFWWEHSGFLSDSKLFCSLLMGLKIMEELQFTLFWFLPLWVCFSYCSLYPSFQSSLIFFSSHKISTLATLVAILWSSLISCLFLQNGFLMATGGFVVYTVPPILMYTRWFMCTHLLICVSISFVYVFGCCGQNIQDISILCL